MTATDELRKLLDERGVEWENRDGFNDWKTKWERGRTRSLYTENKHSGFTVLEAYTLTPEQAIAATLGTPISADLRTALDFMRIWITDDAHLGESAISYEFEKAEGLRKLDAIEQAIAATLGNGTCHDQAAPSAKRFCCSMCCTTDARKNPLFCHGCGRKVNA